MNNPLVNFAKEKFDLYSLYVNYRIDEFIKERERKSEVRRTFGVNNTLLGKLGIGVISIPQLLTRIPSNAYLATAATIILGASVIQWKDKTDLAVQTIRANEAQQVNEDLYHENNLISEELEFTESQISELEKQITTLTIQLNKARTQSAVGKVSKTTNKRELPDRLSSVSFLGLMKNKKYLSPQDQIALLKARLPQKYQYLILENDDSDNASRLRRTVGRLNELECSGNSCLRYLEIVTNGNNFLIDNGYTEEGKYLFESDLAQVATESQGNPYVKSSAGAGGLMQIIVDTGKRYGLSAEDIFIPEKNLAAGHQYSRDIFEKYVDRNLPLETQMDYTRMAFNAGERNLKKGTPQNYLNIGETRNYKKRIDDIYQKIVNSKKSL